MPARILRAWILPLLFCALMPALGRAQNVNANLSGTVVDPSGAAIPAADVTLRLIATGTQAQTKSGPDGLYAFPNIRPAVYELKVTAPGFRDFVQSGIEVAIAGVYRVDVTLQLGTAVQAIEVTANASPLNFDTPTHGGGISPETLKELPLLVAGNPRSAIAFAIIMPGITTGSSDNPYDARINGGIQSGDEAMVDGVSMQEGFMSQNGMVSLYQDWPMTPDMVSEVKVLTSNYEPQYGSTSSGVLIAVTKSGTDTFHGGGYWYHRNTWLNARPFGALNQTDEVTGAEIPRSARPKDLEHDVGGFIGGPAKVPGLWSGKRKTYFYVNFEAFRIVGGVNRPTISIPSLKERQGDFSDWLDADGNLIPVYDPATTRANPAFDPNADLSPTNEPFLRDQFMGCNGNTPNVICSTDPRLVSSLAPQWFQFLPTPNHPGATLNYTLPNPVPDSILAQTNYWLFTGDHYIGDKHHIKAMVWYQGAPPKFVSELPQQLANGTFSAPQYTFVDRINWDYTISSNLLNHAAFGYLDRNEGYGAIDEKYVNDLPQIAGVPAHNVPPVITFGDGFFGYGNSSGASHLNITRRPTAITNDMLTWVHGKHTLKFGGEYRWIAGYVHSDGDQSGSFDFQPSETGLPGLAQSGNALASFLLDQVDSGYAVFRSISSNYPRQHAWSWFVGDTYKLTPKLTLDFGIRWDMYSPSTEKFNRMSFFDPNGVNPGAGGRPGRLAFAGSQWGDASFGRNAPEETFHNGFGPRLGIAYAMTPRTVVRAGYGIFYQQAFYPDWGGGISQDGFSTTASFSSTPYGRTPAFLLSAGLPQNFTLPPFIDSTFDNGKGAPLYRPFDANRLTYAQQWNLTVEHQFTNDFYLSTAYVANKGTRLPSENAPLNALNPSLLSMGAALNDTFESGMTSLDGVPIPYAGWVDQMTGCSPTVAQALLPYPQYCGNLQGLNENAGSSTYHSLQVKAEKRFSRGLSVLGSYTWSKLLTSGTETTQATATTWTGVQGSMSPYERSRVKSLASDDVPHVLSLTFLYELPFGKGKRFLGSHGPWVNRVVGGWEMSHIFRASSGIPWFFRSGHCNVPGQFRMGCIPGIIPGQSIFATRQSGYDPGTGPLFNVNAFQPASSFNFYAGNGTRVTTIRGWGYHNHSMALIKNTKLTEKLNFQIRAEFFNLWNWHIFQNSGGEYGNLPIINDIASKDFGQWDGGSVSRPRNIQIGARLEF